MNKPAVRRRKWKRFKVKGSGIVLLRKTRLLEFGKPKLVEFGPIVDISMGGLAVQYMEDKNRTFDSDELAISATVDDVKVDPIPFKTISDKEVSHIPGGKAIRNRCVEFGKLNTYQAYQLESYIQENTAEIHRDRRISAERRQYEDPRFADPDFKQLYDRRMMPERRTSP